MLALTLATLRADTERIEIIHLEDKDNGKMEQYGFSDNTYNI